MKLIKRIVFLLLLLFIYNNTDSQKIVILHTNDMHSNLTGFGPETAYSPLYPKNDSTLGGFSRLASIIYKEKITNQNATLVLDAGDFLMGTMYHTIENETGFQLNLMKTLGYDAVTIGNHEFDFGPIFLAQAISSAQNSGGTPDLLASQFIFSPQNKFDDNLENLVNNQTIKPYTVFERQGIKFGIFGLIGEDAVSVAPGSAPLKFKNMFKTAKEITKILRETEKVDYIICLSHSGIFPDSKNIMIGEDVTLAKKIPDIDLIISGHTHVQTPKPIIEGKTMIIQTGAYAVNVGRMELNFSDKKLNSYSYSLMPVNDLVEGDPKIHKMIVSYASKVSEKIFEPIGLSYNQPIGELSFDLKTADYMSKNVGHAGQFVCDAVKYYTENFSIGTDVVMVAGGTVRESILKGIITPADVFRVMPLGADSSGHPGSPLAKVWVTAREFKKLTEVLIMNNTPGTDSYIYLSGAKVFYNPEKGLLRKIVKIEINGKPLDFSKQSKQMVSITANTYLLSFIGRIKKMSKGLVSVTPRDEKGIPISNIYLQTLDKLTNSKDLRPKEWIAIIEYIKQSNDTNENGIPDIPNAYNRDNSPYIVTKADSKK